MKYANIRRLGYKDGINRIGIGDYIQLLAIDNIYDELGFLSDAIYMDLWDIHDYRGEKIVLPINQLLGGEPWLDKNGNFYISEDIIPIFIGISLRRGFFNYSEKNIEYLRKNEPIGCRDYYTFQQLRKHHIKSYMAGCITMTLSKRKNCNSKEERVFLVDAPKGVEKYIPTKINSQRKIVHHTFEVDEKNFKDADYARNATVELFEEYCREASLIVTSRLHCAAPCIAMGIPVIITKQYCGYTFDWIQNFVPVYTETEYSDINWDTYSLEIENYKELAKNVAKKRIKGQDATDEIEKLNNFYMEKYDENYQPREMTIDHFINEINNRYTAKDKFDYAIWGVSDVAEKIYEYLLHNFPNAKLVKVIDSFATKCFHNVISEKPSVLQKEDTFVTIVATKNCMDSGAKPLFKTLGKAEQQYIYAADSFI